jgi:predicted aconitase with swiveling domain
MPQLFKGRTIAGGLAEGKALVTNQAISFMGGVNSDTGVLSEINHELYQTKITDRILILPALKGSAAGMWALYRLACAGLGPKAIIVPKADAILIAAVIMGKIPTIDSLDFNPVEKFRSGDRLRVNGEEGTVELLE